MVIDGGRYEVSYKQIAGLLARRIVCTVKEGDRVERGQRVGHDQVWFACGRV